MRHFADTKGELPKARAADCFVANCNATVYCKNKSLANAAYSELPHIKLFLQRSGCSSETQQNGDNTGDH